MERRLYPQNRKYIGLTYCIVVRGGPSHGHESQNYDALLCTEL